MEQESLHLDDSVRVYASARPAVLVAEDDEDCARALSIMLGEQYDVSVHANGRDIVASFEIEVPDLLILDYQLPDINGVRLVETLRKRGGREVPAILMSAYSSRREAAARAGFALFLQKPFGRGELLELVHRALGTSAS